MALGINWKRYHEFEKQFMHDQAIPVSAQDFSTIQESVKLFWKLVMLQGQADPEQISAPIMGYDFHIEVSGPKLIEINTNAAGLLVAGLNPLYWPNSQKFIEKIQQIFKAEAGAAKTIAIVDEQPEQQFYALEFEVLKSILEPAGFKVLVLEPTTMQIIKDRVQYQEQVIDLIYWRHTDFTLEQFPDLKVAAEKAWVKISPSPQIFSILSDKLNLVRWNKDFFESQGLAAEESKILSQVLLPASAVSAQQSQALWDNRKSLVFKPFSRYGGKGVYVGRKITLGKWAEIQAAGDYLAQQYVQPQEVTLKNNSEKIKVDFRAYAWRDELLLLVARGYSGQVTNFRSAGGGFYPTLIESFVQKEIGRGADWNE
jgi:hypothetical protein